ncbi:MAG TPA: hypothetical protein VD767_02155 [Thermomicrobiales bacterium]|nr:hypothetical protein [Thermomicrobiales bacterium]
MDNIKSQAMQKGLPWGRDVKWPVVAAEAAFLIVIGIYMLVDEDGAADIVLQLTGLILLVTSLMLGVAAYRSPEVGLGFFDAFRAGVGATTGAIATASWWSDYIQDAAVRDILGWGLIVYSILHVVGLVVVRGRAGLRLSTVLIVAFTLVLGIVLLTGNSDNAGDRITALGITLLVFGALLAALAYYLYSRAGKEGGLDVPDVPDAPAPPAAS